MSEAGAFTAEAGIIQAIGVDRLLNTAKGGAVPLSGLLRRMDEMIASMCSEASWLTRMERRGDLPAGMKSPALYRRYLAGMMRTRDLIIADMAA